jgi:hypothetical protein
MTRLASFPFLFVFLTSALSGFAQTSTVDVLYLQQDATVLTYDVNPHTAEATQAGQPLGA